MYQETNPTRNEAASNTGSSMSQSKDNNKTLQTAEEKSQPSKPEKDTPKWHRTPEGLRETLREVMQLDDDSIVRVRNMNETLEFAKLNDVLRESLYGNRKALYTHDPRCRLLTVEPYWADKAAKIRSFLADGYSIYRLAGAITRDGKTIRIYLEHENKEKDEIYSMIPLRFFFYEDYPIPQQTLRKMLIPVFERYNKGAECGECLPGFTEDLYSILR